MNIAASNPVSMPSTIERSLGPPLNSSAAGWSSSARRFRMSQWLSLTRTLVAPASSAPVIAALASLVINRRNLLYSPAWRGSIGSVWSSCTTPEIPSMSTEMYTRMKSPVAESATNIEDADGESQTGPAADRARRGRLYLCRASAGTEVHARGPDLHGL